MMTPPFWSITPTCDELPSPPLPVTERTPVPETWTVDPSTLMPMKFPAVVVVALALNVRLPLLVVTLEPLARLMLRVVLRLMAPVPLVALAPDWQLQWHFLRLTRWAATPAR